MKTRFAAILSAMVAAITPNLAKAADAPVRYTAPAIPATNLPFFLHIGPAGLLLSESAKMNVGGAPFPGGSVRIDSQITAAIELGYFVTPEIAVSFTGGFPPTVDVMGKGTAAGLGRIGKATYGPTVLSAHYHFKQFGAFQPYIGAGPTFMIVFGTKDGAMSNVKLNNAVGFAGQIGFNYMFDQKWGMFVDVKKAYLRTTSTGTLGGAPVKANIKLDPLVLHSGLTYRF